MHECISGLYKLSSPLISLHVCLIICLCLCICLCVCVFQQIAPLSRAVLFVDERKAAEEEVGAAAAATGVSSSTDEAEEAMDDALPFQTVSYRALQSIDR